MKNLLVTFLLFAYFSANAQDTIIKTNGEEISSKVLEITPELIKFKKVAIKDGPIFSINKSEVRKIIFENGYIEEFKNTQVKNAPSQLDSFIDKRDNKEYKIVIIGEQTWFAENLAFKTEKSRCYKKKDDYCNHYGMLYTYEDAKKACPDGWHLPSDDDWIVLEIELGMGPEAHTFGWRGVTPGQGYLLKVGGSSGFNAKFGGYWDEGYWGIGKEAFFWTNSDYKNSMGYYIVRFLNQRASISREYKKGYAALSVRCVKDE